MTNQPPPPTTEEAIGYIYFISYVYTTHDAPNVEHHGNRWIGMRVPITTYGQIQRIQERTLAEHSEYRTVTVVSWAFLDRELLDFTPATK